MRIRGLFLRSRVARRTFWVLLAASLVPLALFAALATQTYLSHEARQQRQAQTEFLKHLGLRAYDRIHAARATLAALAQADAPYGDLAHEGGALLRRVAVLGAGGEVRGDMSLVADWHRAGADAGHASAREVWWLPKDSAGPGRVFVRWATPEGMVWIAEISQAFLWADFADDGPAAGLCLKDALGQRLRCPRAPAEDEPSWRLFMKAGFGSPDWVLQGRRSADHDGAFDGVLEVATMAGAATLLLIAVLGLILVRRTMVPLEQLIAGTRRLTAGDWGARVDDRRLDEFGQLARQFNTMAARQGRQLQALGVQSEIDREILGGLDVDRVMGRVVERLQALCPGCEVAVLARQPDGVSWRGHRPDGWVDMRSEPGADAEQALSDELAVHCRPGVPLAPWLREALAVGDERPRQTCWVPARWHGETVAMLVVSTPGQASIDDEARREVEALRDRCAVAIAAAQRERRLVERAVRDDLTGLLNRHGLHDACDRLLNADAGPPTPFALLFVDLDGFKEINDGMGHTAGDVLLRAVADRLRAVLPPDTVLARPGGDEFVALLPGASSDDTAGVFAQQICQRIAQPFVLQGQPQHIGASVGVATCPQDGTEREELLRRADLAMYAAKADGRGRWRRYAEAMDREASERAWILRDLRAALADGTLEAHFQPRIDLRSGRTCGAEALVRWRHPERGMIPPVRFIPVAEESDLIVALGDRMMDLALAQRRRWRDDGLEVERVAVNVSARQLQDPQFAARTLAALSRHGLQPQDLEIEITESLFAGDGATVERALAPLRARGVLVALDDFGTGFSSLSALRRLPVDVMKIDRSFVIELGEDHGAEAVVRSVITLARELGKRVVAEGVETQGQQQRLRALGCDEVQGYRYAKPLPADEFSRQARTGFAAPLHAAAERAGRAVA